MQDGYICYANAAFLEIVKSEDMEFDEVRFGVREIVE